MSKTASSRATTRVVAWACAAGAVACVAVSWLPGARASGGTWTPLVAVALVLGAAGLLTVAAARATSDARTLGARHDELAARLREAEAALGEATAALAAEQEARADQRATVETAVVALSRKVQASAHRIQEEAARMVQRHSADPDVLQTSMRIDHAAAQHARQAQNLVALCGRRPGQTWDEPLALPDVVNAAAGRITAFQRVDVSGDPGLAVVGRAVEPLVHVVAELLANATQCSPPSTRVLVVVRQVQRGAVIEIDDGGVGLAPSELERVREVVSGVRPVGIADLGEVPQTGLAVVGTYARLLGLRVDLVESVYGGLRAVVLVPGQLTTAAAAAPGALAPSVDDPRAEPVSAAPSVVPPPTGAGTGPVATGPARPAPGRAAPAEPRPGQQAASTPSLPTLPQRRSRRAPGATTAGTPAVPAPGAARPEPRPAAPQQTAEEAGAWIGAFFSGGDRAEPQPDHDSQEPSVATDGNSEDR